MKRIIILFSTLVIAGIQLHAQNLLQGRVTNKNTGEAIAGANLLLSGGAEATAISDANGEFRFENLPEASIQLHISAVGMKEERRNIDMPAEGSLEVNVEMTPEASAVSAGKTTSEAGFKERLNEVVITDLDFETEDKGQNYSGLLGSTNDVFNSTAGYTLGSAYFRIRGYDSENQDVYMSGIRMNDVENGRASYSDWGGLNEAMRNQMSTTGLDVADFGFGGVGGTSFIDTRASNYRKQIKATYALSNRTYVNRLMLTYATGMREDGWAFTLSGSRRWGNGGYVEGTYYDAYAYFAAVEKKINGVHSIALTAFGAPTKRGQQGGSVQEAYDLVGSNYYNPNWGYQNGEVRNARIRTQHEPMFLLNYFITPSDKLKITNAISYQFGKFGTTALNWYNARDPRPDYYRYLPSYQTSSAVAELVADEWRNNPAKSQINWDELYQVNYLAKSQGEQATYILEDRRNDASQLSFASYANYNLNQEIRLSGGLEAAMHKTQNYKLISDLLGGTHWKDIDQFAERDNREDLDMAQNDLDNPNRIVKEGDIFGYNYDIHVNTAKLWAQSEMTYNRFEFQAAANVSGTQFWRVGHMRNGRAPENSLGESEKQSFLNFGVKGGATYKITGRHFAYANVGYMTRAPFARNAYISPRIKDNVAANLVNEKIFSADLNYVVRFPNVTGRITVYETVFKDGIQSTAFYHDDYRTFVNYTLSGIDKVHQGIEIGADVKVTKTINITAVAAIGNHRYTSRPTAQISVENGLIEDMSNIVYQKNFYISGTPQNAGSLGVHYQHPKNWYVDLNANYFGKMYLSFNPERRTANAIENISDLDLIKQITEQQKLDDQITVDLSIGKTFYVKDAFVTINLGVTNILNNKNLITGGYEQNRFDFTDYNLDKFPPKYFYMYGTTYFLNIGVRL